MLINAMPIKRKHVGYLILKTVAGHLDGCSTHVCSQSAFNMALKLTTTASFRCDTHLWEVLYTSGPQPFCCRGPVSVRQFYRGPGVDCLLATYM